MASSTAAVPPGAGANRPAPDEEAEPSLRSAALRSTEPCSADPCSAAPCSAAPCSAAPCSAAPCSAAPCSGGSHNAMFRALMLLVPMPSMRT